MDLLPSETLLHILEFLSPEEKSIYRAVCREWRDILPSLKRDWVRFAILNDYVELLEYLWPSITVKYDLYGMAIALNRPRVVYWLSSRLFPLHEVKYYILECINHQNLPLLNHFCGKYSIPYKQEILEKIILTENPLFYSWYTQRFAPGEEGTLLNLYKLGTTTIRMNGLLKLLEDKKLIEAEQLLQANLLSRNELIALGTRVSIPEVRSLIYKYVSSHYSFI